MVEFSVEAVSRDSRRVFNDSDSLSSHPVEQSAFADIRAPDDDNCWNSGCHGLIRVPVASMVLQVIILLMRNLALGVLLLSRFACAQSPPDNPFYVRFGPSFGQPVIGSEDTRRGGYYAVGLERPEPRLTYRGSRGTLQVEGYYLFTKGGGLDGHPVDRMHSYGLLATAKYPNHWIKGWNTHLDLSFGVVYNNITTQDLDSHLNTTPSIGAGVTFGRFDFTVRWYHASNGGTDGNNQGTNQIQYLISVKF